MAIPQFNIINQSDDDQLNLAVYQKFENKPDLNHHAWRVANPSIGTTAFVPVPDDYDVVATYQQGGISYRTKCVGITDYEGAFVVSKDGNDITLDGDPNGSFPNNQVIVRVKRKVQQAVEVAITKGGDSVIKPQVTSPGDSQDFSIIPTLYLARVRPEVSKGGVLVAEEVSTTEIPIQPGQTAYVTGTRDQGYTITVKTGLFTAPC